VESSELPDPSTFDADIALDRRELKDEPQLEEPLRSIGFEVAGYEPGSHWRPSDSSHLDIFVPDGQLTTHKSRRGARLGAQGNRVARRTVGLEAVLVDNKVLTVAALDAGDHRRFRVRVAGPGAMLIAKSYKIYEHDERKREIGDKDATDVCRILRGVPTPDLATRLGRILDNPVAADSAGEGIRMFRELFTFAGRGVQMVSRDVRLEESSEVAAESVQALATDLLEGIGASASH